jgi:hypothetical protein
MRTGTGPLTKGSGGAVPRRTELQWRGPCCGSRAAFLQSLDDLAQKRDFMPNVGPAMLHDADDPAAMHLLAQVLSKLPHLNASAIIADDDGIHWKTIRETAKLVRYVTDHSARSQGNFLFAATAMVKPLGPFYPAGGLRRSQRGIRQVLPDRSACALGREAGRRAPKRSGLHQADRRPVRLKE